MAEQIDRLTDDEMVLLLKRIFGTGRRQVISRRAGDYVHALLEEVLSVLPHAEGVGPGCDCIKCRLVSAVWWLEDETESDLELFDDEWVE